MNIEFSLSSIRPFITRLKVELRLLGIEKVSTIIAGVFFAVLLSPVLDGFDQPIKLYCTVLMLSINSATSKRNRKNLLGNAEIRTRGSWVTERERYHCAMPPP